MLRSVKDLIGYPVEANDGKAGKVKDVLIGDLHWRMRYLDVETRRGFHLNLAHGSEASKEQATRFLIEPEALAAPSMGIERRTFPVRLTREQMSKRPSFGEKAPVEEKFEAEFRRFFRRSFYNERALGGTYAGSAYIPSPAAYEHSDEELQEHLRRMDEIAGEHLHSAKAIIGYHVASGETTLGSVADLILDVDSWRIAFVVVSAHRGFPSRKHLVSSSELVELDWSSATARLSASLEELEDDTRYQPFDAVNKDESGQMYDYCGRPCLRSMMEQIY